MDTELPDARMSQAYGHGIEQQTYQGLKGCGLAINRRWSSPSRITLAFQQYFMYHAAEPTHIVRTVQQGAVRRRHKLFLLPSEAPLGAATNWVSGQIRAFRPRQDYS